MEGYICRRGGGGAKPNFSVVGGNTRPTSTKENLIWIKTDATITSITIDAIQPIATTGAVWIRNHLLSAVGFDSFNGKINGIQTSVRAEPVQCLQYQSGVWTIKEAEIYQDGTWKDFVTYLYNLGNEFENITGGWQRRAFKYIYTDFDAAYVTLYKQASSMRAYLGTTFGSVAGVVETINTIDLTNYGLATINVTNLYNPDRTFAHLVFYTSDDVVKKYAPIHNGLNEIDISDVAEECKVAVGLAVNERNSHIDITWDRIDIR